MGHRPAPRCVSEAICTSCAIRALRYAQNPHTAPPGSHLAAAGEYAANRPLRHDALLPPSRRLRVLATNRPKAHAPAGGWSRCLPANGAGTMPPGPCRSSPLVHEAGQRSGAQARPQRSGPGRAISGAPPPGVGGAPLGALWRGQAQGDSQWMGQWRRTFRAAQEGAGRGAGCLRPASRRGVAGSGEVWASAERALAGPRNRRPRHGGLTNSSPGEQAGR
jgi:hypothetical protein